MFLLILLDLLIELICMGMLGLIQLTKLPLKDYIVHILREHTLFMVVIALQSASLHLLKHHGLEIFYLKTGS